MIGSGGLRTANEASRPSACSCGHGDSMGLLAHPCLRKFCIW